MELQESKGRCVPADDVMDKLARMCIYRHNYRKQRYMQRFEEYLEGNDHKNIGQFLLSNIMGASIPAN